jgi:putative alpha-1,2-mannosidase
MRHRFIPGRGGLPGNEDSGGLSSWYWANAIGLLPVAGQDRYLIGSPAVRKLTLQIGHDPVTLTAKDNSETNIYVRSVIWRGERLTRPYLTIDELRTGGELVLQMTATPTEAFWR